MSTVLFPDHLLFQEKNYFKLKSLCQELHKQVQIQLNNTSQHSNEHIKEIINQCQEIGISEKFQSAITQICEKSKTKKGLLECVKAGCLQHSDADYEKLNQMYLAAQNEIAGSFQEVEKLKNQLNVISTVNQQQLLQIEFLKGQQNEQNLNLSQISQSDIIQPKNIFKQQSTFLEEPTTITVSRSLSNQHFLNSIVELSLDSSQISLSEQSKMVRKSNVISLQTSVLDHKTLIDMENRVKEIIRVYKFEQDRLEKKESNRMQKILDKQEKVRQKKEKSMDDKQKQLLEAQRIQSEKLNQQRQIKFEKEELERKLNEEENHRKQEIVNKRTELENKRLQEILDREKHKIDEKLSKHKNKLGL